mmetsp:Transcript_7368/g.20715  ORF Transcript_7368/g.20715 Transcript_7368/m.20715 type:complete len:209 (+) Transcript_7368:301-927(+)
MSFISTSVNMSRKMPKSSDTCIVYRRITPISPAEMEKRESTGVLLPPSPTAANLVKTAVPSMRALMMSWRRIIFHCSRSVSSQPTFICGSRSFSPRTRIRSSQPQARMWVAPCSISSKCVVYRPLTRLSTRNSSRSAVRWRFFTCLKSANDGTNRRSTGGMAYNTAAIDVASLNVNMNRPMKGGITSKSIVSRSFAKRFTTRPAGLSQ